MESAKTTKYLLRFDDICPTMNWKVWAQIESLLIEHELKPLLAVVPDNRDKVLQVDPPVDNFWDRVREWQERGWDIGLHGFQHKYVGKHRGIVTPRKKTEFAGVPPLQQEEKLRQGANILNREGISPRVWIAPSNSFDLNTVKLLPKIGIQIISDGLFRYPFTCRRNMFWIPQQLFHFRPAPPGVWTVCYHHNYWTSSHFDEFKRDLSHFHSNITSLDEIISDWQENRSPLSAWLSTHPLLAHFLIRTQLKLWGWRRSKGESFVPESITLTPTNERDGAN